MKTNHKTSAVIVFFTLLTLLLFYGCCPPWCPTPSPPPSTTGALGVTLGFGAVTTSGYQCTGQGTVTIRSAGGVTHSQSYSFSGSSSNTSPACQSVVTFPNLQPGSWN